jgi:hypothetical protein
MVVDVQTGDIVIATLSDEEIAAIEEATRRPRQAPPLSARQLRLGLVLNGFELNQVETAIDAIDDAQSRAIARVEWEYASLFERDHPLLIDVGVALGLSPEDIDEMWLRAALL